MGELIRNAWMGWLDYTTYGKLAALFFGALLFFWLRGEEDREGVLSYSALMAALCLCPVTAAVLMLYQSRFYDYQWIWGLVPVTLVIAWGISVLLTRIWEKYKKGGLGKRIGFTLLTAAILVMCGDMGAGGTDAGAGYHRENVYEKQQKAQEVLAGIFQLAPGKKICLWAPREIMEFARSGSGSVELVYGRDMWDLRLGAYTYDSYDENCRNLYLWMQDAEETGELEGKACLAAAKAAGVNCILLPGNVQPEALEGLAGKGQIQTLEGYYLLFLP